MQVRERGGEKDGEGVEVAARSSRSVLDEASAQVSREAYGPELGMSNRGKMWVMAELWSTVNSALIFSSVGGCMDHRSRASAILTSVASSRSNIVPKIPASATLVLDADKDGLDADDGCSVCSSAVEKGRIDVPARVARQQLRADLRCRAAVVARLGSHCYCRQNFGCKD